MEDNSSAPERTEDLLDHETGERIAKSEATRQQVGTIRRISPLVHNGKNAFIYNCCTFCVGSEQCRTCSRKTEKTI